MSATRSTVPLLAGALLLGMAGPARAQIDDVRWLPFIGCWQPVDDAEAGLVCFSPAERGVEMTSWAAGAVVATELLVADGQARPVRAEGCEGTESLRFSEDGRRAFTRSEIVCGGDRRPGTGVMSVVAPNRWADVRALRMQGETVSWVQEYRLIGIDRLAEEGIDDPAAGMEGSVRSARVVAAREIDTDDVREAVANLDTEAVVAWVATQGDGFVLDGDGLLALADEGVPESVIDVMVAVSYPERFVVAADQGIERAGRAEQEYVRGRRVPVHMGYRGYLAWDPFFDGYGYGYGFGPFAYSPFGYGRFGYFGGYGYPYTYGPYGYGPTVIRVERRPSGGRAVFGRGWTRRSGDSKGGAVPRGGSAAAGSRGGSGSGGGAIAGSGGSGGSRPASSGSGRTARRRGGE